MTLHGLRHTWASLALQAGINPKVVSERLGHTTVSFTLDTYWHVMPGMKEDAAARVASPRVQRLGLHFGCSHGVSGSAPETQRRLFAGPFSGP